MRVVTFDIETSNWLQEAGSFEALNIAIVCIHDSETNEYTSYLEPELGKLWKILERTDILVGYNSDHFDIPLLNKYYPGDLSRIKSVDILKEVHASLGRRIKLDSIAEATLGSKKSASGAQSLIWWRNGEVDKVRQYCQRDVEITRKVFDYALKNGAVKYKELSTTREIKLDTSKWLVPATQPLTFTLGL